MTQPDGLYQAILDDPDDDVRLVYADWLEEHGEPQRADFIRVQIELALLPEGDLRRGDLEARERALLKEHESEWAEPLRPWAIRWTFRRGFVEEVTVPAQVYLDHAASLARLAPIRRFVADLSEAAIPPAILEKVPGSLVRELVLPLGERGRSLVVAMRDPEDAEATRKLAFILNRVIDAVAASPEQLADIINHYYYDDLLEIESVVTGRFFTEEDPVEFDVAREVSRVARLVSLIVHEVRSGGATEVRIEAAADVLHVRYRINGELVERSNPSRHLLDGIWERELFLTAILSRLRACCGDLDAHVQTTDHGPSVAFTLRPAGPRAAGRHLPR